MMSLFGVLEESVGYSEDVKELIRRSQEEVIFKLSLAK